ncbi:hypothetical protein Gpo141_00007942 [Globisporangium polare]
MRFASEYVVPMDPSSSDSIERLLAESEALLQSLSEGPSSPCASPPSPLLSSAVALPAAATTSDNKRRAKPASSCPPVPTVKKKRSRNSTRDREQSELQFLRRHVCELEAEAARLLLSHRNGARANDGESGNTSRGDTPRSVSSWQRLAQRQKKVRAVCEQQRRSLASQVVERATLIGTLRELLLAHQSASSQRHALSTRHALAQTDWDEASVFARLKRDAVRAFERSDHVLAENGIHRRGGMAESIEDNVLSHGYDQQSQRFVSRLVSTRVFPFDIHATSNATWRAIASTLFTDTTGSGVHAGSEAAAMQSGVQVIERSGSTYAVSYVVTLSVNGAELVVRARDVVTRFVSATQAWESVFVWQTSLENVCGFDTDCREGPPSQIRGSGWLVFQQPQNACSSSVLRSVFEFHTTTAADFNACEDYDVKDEDAVKVQVLKAWAALGEGCVDTIALHVDESLLTSEALRST